MATLDDPTINTMTNDEIGDAEWDAPESGSMPPRVTPGIYDFLFKLEDTPFETKEVKDAQAGTTTNKFVVNHKAEVEVVDPVTSDKKEVEIRFIQVDFKRSEKMKEAHMNAKGVELLRSLGLKVDPFTRENIEDALRGADGRAHGRAVIGWQFYCKDCKETVSTFANTKRGEVPWPRDAERNYVLVVKCPKCGQSGYGRERIQSYKLPVTGNGSGVVVG